MSHLPFRTHHLHCILAGYAEQPLPLDLFLHHYFRSHRALGGQDRGYLAETLYGLIRWRGLIDYLVGADASWEERLHAFETADFVALGGDSTIPIDARVSFPKELFELLAAAHGTERAIELCQISNYPAPTAIRVNSAKISRAELFDRWKERYDIELCQLSPHGIIFRKKINFFGLEEFKLGYFEVQDEGSQLLASLVQPSAGDLVMDYCAGSGGKTLAFAPSMHAKGQIFLHDIRENALQEARKRLKRAGIQNAQLLHSSDHAKLQKLKKKIDWVLVDAPCSGTGTLRRNPDMKWKLDSAAIERLVGVQRQIFERALSFLKPGGKIF
jgi:16S rRNA C967 or C1407 C5-methylase (RsmB/RsmF family)